MRYITFMFITLILSACSSRVEDAYGLRRSCEEDSLRPCRNIEGQQQICSDTHRGGNGYHRVGNG